MNRRRLLASLATVAVAPGMGVRMPGTAARLVVLVRQQGGDVAVDPFTGAVAATDAFPASPVASATLASLATPVILPDGDVRYWVASPSGDAAIWQRADAGSGAWWWQRDGQNARRLALPTGLEPALPSGTVARWFHGAVLDAAHLGTGTLRLVAVDVETGQTVLDRSFDRRLELAATAVSDDGSVVAHVQGGNARIDIWAADLAHGTELERSVAIHPVAPVAPGAIDLDVALDVSGAVVAAGLRWAWPGHPAPRVIVAGEATDGTSRVTEVSGELIGIQPTLER